MRAIKWYRVFDDDIDDNGELNPDARLIPYYASLYNWDPYTSPVETYSSEDHYDNSTNVHKGRHFTLYKDADKTKGNTHFTNKHVTNRGYSAAGYERGRDRWDNLFFKWNHYDPNVSRSELEKNRNVWAQAGGSKDDYQLNSAVHLSPKARQDFLNEKMHDNAAAIERRDVDSLAHAMYNMGEHGKQVPYISEGKSTIPLPFIIEGDDDDIVSLADVMERDYDPGRDWLNEVQLKNIRLKRLPSGVLAPNDEHPTSDVLRKVLDSQDKLEKVTDRYANGNGEATIQDINNWAKEAKESFAIVCSAVSEYLDEDEPSFTAIKAVNKGLYSNNFYEGVCNYLGVPAIEGVDPDNPDNGPVVTGVEYIIHEAVNEVLSCISTYMADKLNKHKLNSYSPWQWQSILNEQFNIDDAQNVSDAHCKHIIKDASNYIKKYGKKNVSGIADSIADWRF